MNQPNHGPSGVPNPSAAPPAQIYTASTQPYQTPLTVQQVYQRELTQKMVTPKGLCTTLFAFFFGYLYIEAAITNTLPGLGVTLCVVVFCLYTFYALYFKNTRRNRAALILYIPILIIGLGFSLHYNPSSHLPMTLTLFVLLALQLMLLCNADLKEPFSADMIRRAFGRVLIKPLSYLAAPFKTLSVSRKLKSNALRYVGLALLGLLISVPVCLLLLGWFSGADVAFADGLQRFTQWLEKLIAPQWARIFLNLFLLVLLGTPLAAILLFNTTDTSADAPAKARSFSVHTVLLTTFLLAVATVMVTFVATQFTYFFFGATNGAIEDIGYAQYARNGFFELCYASCLVFAVVVLALTLSKKKENGRLPLPLAGLLSVICLSNIVILVSAVMRMTLYVDAHGLSIKRLMTLWLMPILGICTLILIVRIFAIRLNALKAVGTTVIIAVCLLAVSNTDRIVAKQQVDRYIASGYTTDFDTGYFKQLSYASLPEIDRILADENNTLTNSQRVWLSNRRKSLLRDLAESDERNGIMAYTFDRISYVDKSEEETA